LALQPRSFFAQLGLDIELASRRVEDFCSSICVGICSVLSMVPGGVSGFCSLGPRHRLASSPCRGFVRVPGGRFCFSAPLGVSGWSLRPLWDHILPSFFNGFSLVLPSCCVSLMLNACFFYSPSLRLLPVLFLLCSRFLSRFFFVGSVLIF